MQAILDAKQAADFTTINFLPKIGVPFASVLHLESKRILRIMKAKYSLLLLLPAVVLLMTGCPVGLDYSLGTPGSEEINKTLIGTWVNGSEEAEVKRVKIVKGKENSYDVTVLERGEMYSLETDNLQGWVTTLEEKSFLYLKPVGEDKFYHYCYWMEGEILQTSDVSLLDGGVDAVTSTETLRKQVATSMRMKEWGSEIQEWSKD